MYKLLKTTLLLLLSLLYLGGVKSLLADEWVLKSDDYSLSRSLFEQTLRIRGFTTGSLSEKQRQALLQELFIRENLLRQQDKVATAVLLAFNEQQQEQRRNQLARLTLDALAEEGMPDFSRRAKELYEVRKNEQYQLPLRLRVRILQQTLLPAVAQQTVSDNPTNQVKIVELKGLLTKIKAGKLDFKQAVVQYSDDPKRTLHVGDSFWFQKGQKAEFIFTAAKALSPAQPLSDVLIQDGHAYILRFIGRQEPVQQSFAEVRDGIIDELQAVYREENRKLVLSELRDRFRNNTEIHPDFRW